MRGKLPKEKKYVKRQRWYHSSSEDEGEDEGVARDAPRDFKPVSLESSDEEEQEKPAKPVKAAKPAPKFKATIPAKKAAAPAKEDLAPSEDENEDEGEGDDASEDEDEEMGDDFGVGDDSDGSDASSISETSTNARRNVRKRNDPEAFATSISKILNTKLTSSKRSEPILSRSKTAEYTNKQLSDLKLTQKAKHQLLAEKRAAQEKGREKDVLGLDDPEVSTAAQIAKEKALRRTAQKGVIKLFNAVRAAQVKAEQAEKEAREKGLVGMSKREERVKEMSKQGFLEMIAGQAKKKEGSVEA